MNHFMNTLCDRAAVRHKDASVNSVKEGCGEQTQGVTVTPWHNGQSPADEVLAGTYRIQSRQFYINN